MAKVHIQSAGGGGSVATGVLQLQNGTAMDATLRIVTDQNNTTSPLKLSTGLVSVASTLQIATSDTQYLDAEDLGGNNRFTISRNAGSQVVNVDFASNPTLGTDQVGAIRTYQDGVSLSDSISFIKNGNLQVGGATGMYWDNTNKRLGVGTNAPTEKITAQTSSAADGISLRDASNQLALLGKWFDSSGFLDLAQNGSAYARIQASQSYLNTSFTVGSTSALSARLGIKGSGSTFATTSLLVQNSAGANQLRIRDDGNVFFEGGGALNASGLIVTNYGYFGGLGYSANVILGANSTTAGFLPPRMTTTQKNAISSPAAGLVVYDTTLNKLCVYTTAWETITSV